MVGLLVWGVLVLGLRFSAGVQLPVAAW